MIEMQSQTEKTIVVVAPRILLAEQLCSEFLEFITNASVMHVHSGETHHFSTTKPQEISNWWVNTRVPRITPTTSTKPTSMSTTCNPNSYCWATLS